MHLRVPAVACTVRRPLHCDCVRQCFAAGAFAAHLYPICFRRRAAAGNASAVTALSVIPPRSLAEIPPRSLSEIPPRSLAEIPPRSLAEIPPRSLSEIPPRSLSEIPPPERLESHVFLSYRPLSLGGPSVDWRRVSADHALAVEHSPHLRHVPHRHCPRRCSGHGACVSGVDEWRRAGGAAGGRGWARPAPLEAFCRCDAYYSGRACETHAPTLCWNNCSGRGACVDGFCSCVAPYYGPACAYGARRASARSRARHLRIHVYDLDAIVLRRHTYGSDPDPIFNTPHVFLSALLADSHTLEEVPDDADLYLAPAFGTNMEGLVEYYEHALRHLERERAHHWRRRRGADHVWLTSADGGGCDMRRLDALDNAIVVAHYLKLNSSSHRCGVAGRDLALPPIVPATADPAFLHRGLSPAASRPRTLFFAGNVPDAHLVDGQSDEALGREAYSEGVRQLVWKHHRAREGFRVVARSSSYVTDWAGSRYCLAPLGVGWGVRLLWAIASGCVPVAAETAVAAWFDDALDFDAFAVRGLPKASLPGLHRTLAAIPPGRLASMQTALLNHRQLFLWGAAGCAYNVTLHELCWRARHRRATVECARLLPRAAADLVLPPRHRTRLSLAQPGWYKRVQA